MADRAFLERLSKELVDKGKLIEAGWVSLRIVWLPLNCPANQLDELRQAFFAGSQHLFSSIMTILEPGAEPTEKDLDRFTLINNELQEFIKDFELRCLPTKGSA